MAFCLSIDQQPTRAYDTDTLGPGPIHQQRLELLPKSVILSNAKDPYSDSRARILPFGQDDSRLYPVTSSATGLTRSGADQPST